MNFERYKDLKETLGIGIFANPIVISTMYTSDSDFSGFKDSNFANMSDKEVRRILESISKSELGIGWENRYYVGKISRSGIIKKGISQITFQIISIKDCRGFYLEFQRQKYLIPAE